MIDLSIVIREKSLYAEKKVRPSSLRVYRNAD